MENLPASASVWDDEITLPERDAVDIAMAQAVRDALLEHKRVGNPVATWENGQVKIIPADEIVIPDLD